MKYRALAVGVLALVGLTTVPSRAADATTRCAFGGPTAGSRVFHLDLAQAADSLTMQLTAARKTTAPTGPENSHLAQGVFVLDASTKDPVAWLVRNEGTNPRRVVVDSGTADPTAVAAPGVDTPFVHEGAHRVPGLEPGSYLIVAFGSDGSPEAPNAQWGGEVVLSGSHVCEPVSSGQPFDVNHTDFTGGTQVSAPGVAAVDGASYSQDLDSSLVVGFIDASVQGPGDARVDYEHPDASGEVADAIAPFVSTRGTYRWTAALHGVAVASVVGLGVNA